jgi:trigger factor
MLKEYTKSIQIPGFRKGKVPQEVLIRKFGDSLKGEALARIMEKSIEEIFDNESFPKEDRPLPYSTPQVQDKPELDLDKDFEFSMIYDVYPIVKVEKWEGLEAEIPDVSISDEDISKELELIRERNSIVLDKNEGEVAATADVVTVNYSELSEAGELLQGTEREDFTFTLGSGYNFYKFDDEVKGMKKGETREFDKSFPENFDEKELAGKTKKIKVSLTALKIKKLPDLDDDLAQDVDAKFNTLEDLKASIRERLNKDLEQRLRNVKYTKLLEKIMENTPVKIPESMLRFELDSRWRTLARRLNTDSDGLYKLMGNSTEQAEALINTWKPAATNALHSRLIVENIMEELKLEASDEEIEKDIERMATEAGAELEDFKKYYEDANIKEYIKEELKERKLLDILLEKNKINTGAKVKDGDFVSANGQVSEDD